MYLTYDEYLAKSKNPKVTEVSFEMYEPYAEAVINAYSFGIIDRENLIADNIHAKTIKLATALQIDFMATGGIDGYIGESGKDISSRSVSVGGTSESVSYGSSGSSKGNKATGGMEVHPFAVSLLPPIIAMGRVL